MVILDNSVRRCNHIPTLLSHANEPFSDDINVLSNFELLILVIPQYKACKFVKEERNSITAVMYIRYVNLSL